MNIWLYKKIDINEENFLMNEKVNIADQVYVYYHDESKGNFIIVKKLVVKDNSEYETIVLSEPQEIDLPYSIHYKTKTNNSMVLLSKKEITFIIDNHIGENIIVRFRKYIKNDWNIETKKIEKRIEYLNEMLPKRLNSVSPISIFRIFDFNKLNNISTTLKKGNHNYDWDRSFGGGGEIQQTLNRYIKFLEELKSNDPTLSFSELSDNKLTEDINSIHMNDDEKTFEKDTHKFISFLRKRKFNLNTKIDLKYVQNNIEFVLGQPNTGKSFNYEKKQLFDEKYFDYCNYLKIPVSGGRGNEYKGLQSTDLAITYDPIKECIRFGDFLKVLMSAIVNPDVPHVIFLDDFHNQDISSLLSEYTPLFKSQQIRKINDINPEHEIFDKSFSNVDEFIKTWNKFINFYCHAMPIVPLTNRISGEFINLIFPSNFYLLAAGNFNENTLNIFADWEDRASIKYKDPLEQFKLSDNSDYLKCCIEINESFKSILEDNNIFDYEKYCFGLWKVTIEDGTI
ncbi:MAG: hypothetical protein HRT42_14970, partial [Campylobacteraceae bacterium]|nr:hypothetical protein [Campylobacteraceae bacterium]